MHYWQPPNLNPSPIDYETYKRRRMAYYTWRKSPKGKQMIATKFRTQMGKCFYCNTKLHSGKYHLDHITPLWRGGRNHHTNYVLACTNCNLKKSANNPYKERIRAKQADIAAQRKMMPLATKIAERYYRQRGYL